MNPCFVKVTLRNPIEGEAKGIYKNMSGCARDAITDYCRLRDIKLHYGE